jgi:phosphate transport system permease protein
MAVLMVTGNASVIPASIFEPVRTIPATIAAELGEAPFGGTHFKALFALGIILFLITLTFNLMVDYVKVRRRKLMS